MNKRMASSHVHHVHHVNTSPPKPPMMIHLHGGDNNMTFDEKTNTYNWVFRTSFPTSSIQLVDFDIPVPLDKSTRLFVRVPKVSCILESNENNRDLCYIISLYTTKGRIVGRVNCNRVGQEIPVVFMENRFSIRITDQDDNPVRLSGDDFDFLFKLR